jgi:cytochrome bd-type quinol oxidase subunit 2
MMTRMLAYLWPAPYTIFGIAVGLMLGCRFRRVEGVIEIHGPWLAHVLGSLPVPALAMTMGHVVFGQTAAALDITRRHEHVHVRQYERWGLLFVPAYLAVSTLLYLRGRDGYRENPFEVEAYAVDTPRHPE